jgi:hypothetical protein
MAIMTTCSASHPECTFKNYFISTQITNQQNHQKLAESRTLNIEMPRITSGHPFLASFKLGNSLERGRRRPPALTCQPGHLKQETENGLGHMLKYNCPNDHPS